MFFEYLSFPFFSLSFKLIVIFVFVCFVGFVLDVLEYKPGDPRTNDLKRTKSGSKVRQVC